MPEAKMFRDTPVSVTATLIIQIAFENSMEMPAGMVVTEEHRIYLLGFGSIRIEDTVLVGRGGAEKLTVGAYYLGK